MAALDAYLTRISVFPEIAPTYFQDVRQQVMQRFPYGIFYEPEPTHILVLAILDLRQDEEQILFDTNMPKPLMRGVKRG